jgi:cardiolipin synthase
MAESMIAGNSVELLHDGACLPAMLAAVEAAQHEILLEMYWFDSDQVGRTFAEALCEKARKGVRVCVTFDAVGSFEADRAMFDAMRAAGADVYEYNPVRFLRRRFSFAGLNRRNHRKMLVIDGHYGFTGGVNIADPWTCRDDGGREFRDDMVAIDGPVVGSMRAIFLNTFRGRSRAQALAEPPPVPAATGASGVRVLSNERWRRRRLIDRTYLSQIRGARDRILIANSYFIPSRIVRHALAQAVRRGVSVKVLVPLDSDVPAVRYASTRLYEWLLERGVELYEWPRNYLHSKTAAIDGAWCTVGTHNLDHRSWAYNLEINVAIDDATVARRLEERIRADLGRSVRVDLHTWRFRPLGQRLLEALFYMFRHVL